MKEQFVGYEIALKLKELGFDEECLAYYSKEAIYEDKDGNKTNFVLLSAKKRGELVGHGSVRNYLFQWLLDNDRTHGELSTLSQSVTAPLWQQAIDWIFKNYEILVSQYLPVDKSYLLWWVKSDEDDFYSEKEQAILKAIELCKNILNQD